MSLFIYCLFVWKYRPKVLLICGIRVGNSCNYFREIHALHTNDSQKIHSCILRQFGRYNLIVHVYPKKVTFFGFKKSLVSFVNLTYSICHEGTLACLLGWEKGDSL